MGSISKINVVNELRRVFWFTFFTALVVATSIVVENNAPNEYLYQDGDWDWEHPYQPEYNQTQWNILFDQHSHTTYSSDGDLTPEQNLQWHMSMGYNAVAITDHNTFEGAIEAQRIAREKYGNNIKVFIGMEWTTDRMHMNCYFPPTLVDTTGLNSLIIEEELPSDTQIQDFIVAVHNLGGVVTVNHLPRSYARSTDHPTRQMLYDWGVDNFEVCNRIEWDSESVAFCESHGMGMMSGTDMHKPGTVYAWTLMKVENFTEIEVFDQIIARQTEVIMDPIGTPYTAIHKANPLYLGLKPLILIGALFKNYETEDGLNWGGIAVLLAYAYGVFVIAEFIRVDRAKFWENIHQKRQMKEKK